MVVIPNGGRVYYLDRSQPPVLTQLVRKYFEATNVWYPLHLAIDTPSPQLGHELSYIGTSDTRSRVPVLGSEPQRVPLQPWPTVLP